MDTPVVLGIDTSNYRTSLCLMDGTGEVMTDQRQLLTVEAGERGLQQSVAVFQHVQSLAKLAQEVDSQPLAIRAVAVSDRPRPQPDSYMPVFVVGYSYASWLSSFLRVPLFATSHQEGHIWSALWEFPFLAERNLLVFHLSGGTSDLLLVTPQGGQIKICRVGGSEDLHVGQLVDRIGVALGLPFPAGPALEELARRCDGEERKVEVSLPSSVRGLSFSFSGPEAAAKRLLGSDYPAEQLARAVERCIANTLEKTLRNAWNQGLPKDVIFVGGVAANQWIRGRLQQRFSLENGCLFFANPAYAGDNSCGVAYWGWRKLREQGKE